MTKTEMAKELAAGDYAVRIGMTDAGYAARQYVRLYTKAELEASLASRRSRQRVSL